MKTTITILVLASIVFACSRKTVASSDNVIISNRTDTKTSKNENTPDVVSSGQTIYTTRCGRCHGLKKAENYTPQRWENILKSMIPKAKLNDEEAKHVTAYVMEHAKK